MTDLLIFFSPFIFVAILLFVGLYFSDDFAEPRRKKAEQKRNYIVYGDEIFDNSINYSDCSLEDLLK